MFPLKITITIKITIAKIAQEINDTRMYHDKIEPVKQRTKICSWWGVS